MKENIMLILVIRHQIHKDVRNEQHKPLISAGQKGHPRQGQNGIGQKRKLFRIYALIDHFMGDSKTAATTDSKEPESENIKFRYR